VKYVAAEATALTPQATGALKKRLSGLAPYDAWKKANGPVALKGLEGPSGSKATVLIAGKQALSWTPTDLMTISFVVTRGADKSVSTMDDDASASLINERSTEVWWDPTGRRALFSVSVQGEETIRGVVADTALYFIVATPPRVEVLASPRLKAEAERVAGVVEKTGFAVVTVGPATKDRPATVIYAGPAHQEAAQRLAAALPGATVEKLTWKANGELVVTVGAK
jgi:LytR cell envelope-related transcriptional attenuator